MPESEVRYWCTLAACNLPVFIILGKLIFGSFGEFWECIVYMHQPESVSLILGESDKDANATFKLLGFLVLCAALLGGEHLALTRLGLVGEPPASAVQPADDSGP